MFISTLYTIILSIVVNVRSFNKLYRGVQFLWKDSELKFYFINCYCIITIVQRSTKMYRHYSLYYF